MTLNVNNNGDILVNGGDTHNFQDLVAVAESTITQTNNIYTLNREIRVRQSSRLDILERVLSMTDQAEIDCSGAGTINIGEVYTSEGIKYGHKGCMITILGSIGGTGSSRVLNYDSEDANNTDRKLNIYDTKIHYFTGGANRDIAISEGIDSIVDFTLDSSSPDSDIYISPDGEL